MNIVTQNAHPNNTVETLRHLTTELTQHHNAMWPTLEQSGEPVNPGSNSLTHYTILPFQVQSQCLNSLTSSYHIDQVADLY
jgi:hypothetical protein